VYAYDLGSGKLAQVTNVLTGAYMPAVSNDGRRLVYVGYHSKGFDLYELPLDPARYLPALDPPSDRLPPVEPGMSHAWPTEAYDPLPTLRPHAWTFKYGDGNFGKELQITTSGADVIGRHAFDLSIGVPTTTDAKLGAEPQLNANYYYNRLPFGFRFALFRDASLRNDYRYGNQSPLTTEHLNGVATGVSWAVPGEFDAQSVSLSYTIAKFSRELPVGSLADPFSYVTIDPDRGYIALLHLGYSYSNAFGTTYGISAENGFSIGLGLDEAAHALGSESTLTAISGVATAYRLMPWAEHHVLALALSGGTALGSYARRGLYATGGFVKDSLYDEFNGVIRQSSFVLRGYQPGKFVGTAYNLLNAEYRFPIWYADRGLSTLPIFLRTVRGVLFFDYGGAYDTLDVRRPFHLFHGSVGGEIWLDGVTSYFVQNNLRLGLARRLEGNKTSYQGYAVIVAGF
jgi:hypothetical protein